MRPEEAKGSREKSQIKVAISIASDPIPDSCQAVSKSGTHKIKPGKPVCIGGRSFTDGNNSKYASLLPRGFGEAPFQEIQILERCHIPGKRIACPEYSIYKYLKVPYGKKLKVHFWLENNCTENCVEDGTYWRSGSLTAYTGQYHEQESDYTCETMNEPDINANAFEECITDEVASNNKTTKEEMINIYRSLTPTPVIRKTNKTPAWVEEQPSTCNLQAFDSSAGWGLRTARDQYCADSTTVLDCEPNSTVPIDDSLESILAACFPSGKYANNTSTGRQVRSNASVTEIVDAKIIETKETLWAKNIPNSLGPCNEETPEFPGYSDRSEFTRYELAKTEETLLNIGGLSETDFKLANPKYACNAVTQRDNMTFDKGDFFDKPYAALSCRFSVYRDKEWDSSEEEYLYGILKHSALDLGLPEDYYFWFEQEDAPGFLEGKFNSVKCQDQNKCSQVTCTAKHRVYEGELRYDRKEDIPSFCDEKEGNCIIKEREEIIERTEDYRQSKMRRAMRIGREMIAERFPHMLRKECETVSVRNLASDCIKLDTMIDNNGEITVMISYRRPRSVAYPVHMYMELVDKIWDLHAVYLTKRRTMEAILDDPNPQEF